MRRPIIAGNWKCQKTSTEAVELVKQLRPPLDAVRDVEVIVCPPFTALQAVASHIAGSTIGLGAQDLFWEPSGAFTGEISAAMLLDVGCRACLVGHSERRQYFGETDQHVHQKLKAALAHGLVPILCVGETLPQREQAQTREVLRRQMDAALHGFSAEEVGRLVIAYEPVWAIGTGRNATAAQAQEAQAFLRERIAAGWKAHVAQRVRIQYGGSVNASNALELLQQPDVDGALVGGASLKAESFVSIVKAASEAKVVHSP